MKTLKVGAWIEAGEGIAQVIAVVETFVEEYSPAYRSGRALGEYLDSLVIYKVLCGHGGTIRKRQLITYSTLSGVSEASPDSLRIAQELQNDAPERYQKFLDYKAKRPLEHNYTVWLNVPENSVDDLAAHVNNFVATGAGAFTYDKLFAHLLEKAPDLDVEIVHRQYSRTTNNLRLVLQNEDLRRQDKRALLVGASASVR